MTTDTTHTTLDARQLAARERSAAIKGYRDLEAQNRRIGCSSLAEYCALRASALEHGGTITLAYADLRP